MVKLVAAVLLALALVGVVASAVLIVDASESCAIVEVGQVVGQAHTGFQLVWPLITSVSCYPRQVHIYQTVVDAKGDADYVDFPVEIKTGDGQTAYVEFNLVYYVPPENVEKIRREVASNEDELVTRVVGNYSRTVPRDLAPDYTASQLYGIGRVDYEGEIDKQLRVIFASYGVVLDRFALRDVNFDDEYEKTIEGQQISREQIETEGYKADAAVFTARQTAALAKGEADAEIERARGHAEAVRIQASADAESIEIRGSALQKFPEVLNLEYIKVLPTAQWMLIPWDQITPFMPLPGPVQ